MSEAPKASIKDIRDATKIDSETAIQWAGQWKRLSDEDKAEIRQGVADGSQTY